MNLTGEEKEVKLESLDNLQFKPRFMRGIMAQSSVLSVFGSWEPNSPPDWTRVSLLAVCEQEVEQPPASWGSGVPKDQGLGPGSRSRLRALAHKVIEMWLFTRKRETFWHQRRKPNKKKQRKNHRF